MNISIFTQTFSKLNFRKIVSILSALPTTILEKKSPNVFAKCITNPSSCVSFQELADIRASGLRSFRDIIVDEGNLLLWSGLIVPVSDSSVSLFCPRTDRQCKKYKGRTAKIALLLVLLRNVSWTVTHFPICTKR